VFTIGNQLMETLKQHTSLTKKQAYDRSVEMLRLVGINNPEQRMKHILTNFPAAAAKGDDRHDAFVQSETADRGRTTTALDVTIQRRSRA
jgi:ABC-type microcin C transport system duplicated ATPase subunit YejF